MTAPDLIRELHRHGATCAVEGEDLIVTGPVPRELVPILEILRSPIIAVLTGRPLLGFLGKGVPCGGRRDGVLDPNQLLHRGIRMVCAKGLPWDRISKNAAENHPEIFQPAPATATPSIALAGVQAPAPRRRRRDGELDTKAVRAAGGSAA